MLSDPQSLHASLGWLGWLSETKIGMKNDTKIDRKTNHFSYKIDVFGTGLGKELLLTSRLAPKVAPRAPGLKKTQPSVTTFGPFWDPAGGQESTKIDQKYTFCLKGGLGKRLLNNFLLIFAPLPFGVALRTDFWRHFSLKCGQITIVSAILRKTRFSEKH